MQTWPSRWLPVSVERRRTQRDVRRRTLSQNFLVDQSVVDRIVRHARIGPEDLILEIGAGTGLLTMTLLRTGARVIAVEQDPVWVGRLCERVAAAGLEDDFEVRAGDIRTTRLPTQAYRVIANPPFNLTTALMSLLLDEPARGPTRIDLLVQREVARKRASIPPSSLRSAAWAPWWDFELGFEVPRSSFRPVPRVDAALLTIRRRIPGLLPDWLAPGLRDLLRPGWKPPARQ